MTGNVDAVTKQDIYMACNHLWQCNTAPTVERVRRVIGRGSYTTIGKYVKAWKEENQSLVVESKVIPISPTQQVLQQLVGLVQNDSGKLVDLETKVSTLEARVSKLESDLAELRVKHEQLQNDFNRLADGD